MPELQNHSLAESIECISNKIISFYETTFKSNNKLLEIIQSSKLDEKAYYEARNNVNSWTPGDIIDISDIIKYDISIMIPEELPKELKLSNVLTIGFSNDWVIKYAASGSMQYLIKTWKGNCDG